LSLLILLVILIDSLLDLIWLVEFKTWPLLLVRLILLVGFRQLGMGGWYLWCIYKETSQETR
jgi:hypothetical protein